MWKYNIEEYSIIVEKGLKGGLRYSYFKDNNLVYRTTIRKFHNIDEELRKGIEWANAQFITIEDIINSNDWCRKTSLDSILRVLKEHNYTIKDEIIKEDEGNGWYTNTHKITINDFTTNKHYDSFKLGIIDTLKELFN